MEPVGVPHVVVLRKSNPWYVDSHCVLARIFKARLKLESVTLLQGALLSFI
jgi:hypothetical protein